MVGQIPPLYYSMPRRKGEGGGGHFLCGVFLCFLCNLFGNLSTACSLCGVPEKM